LVAVLEAQAVVGMVALVVVMVEVWVLTVTQPKEILAVAQATEMMVALEQAVHPVVAVEQQQQVVVAQAAMLEVQVDYFLILLVTE
tara:strand:+ start:203 stop:460 length:258 start_codon:yes stop_codon:yes gene_type:complete